MKNRSGEEITKSYRSFWEKTKSLRRITAVLHISTEISDSKPSQGTTAKRKYSLKQHLLEKMKTWINSLLEGERDEFLGRDRHARLDQGHDNYRNGYRPRRINFFGLGEIELKVPRDRQGEFTSQWLPERKGQDPELEALLAEAFLAGLSTRDLARISEKHLGHKYDSKQISRIVSRATKDLEVWRQRSLQGQRYKFLYLDGANFRVRINGHVSVQSFCAVLGVSEENERFEVLALEMGDRERADLWESIFRSLGDRELDLEAVELGILDGLPGLEAMFKRFFTRAQTCPWRIANLPGIPRVFALLLECGNARSRDPFHPSPHDRRPSCNSRWPPLRSSRVRAPQTLTPNPQSLAPARSPSPPFGPPRRRFVRSD